MPLLPLASLLAQFAPSIAGFLGGKKAEEVAQKVVDIAKTVTGQSTPDAALSAIQSDPNLALQFQTKVVESNVQLQQISASIAIAEVQADSANVQAVNKTMQAEALSEHWPTYSWRPFIGFSFGIVALITALVVITAYVGVMFFGVEPAVLVQLPPMIGMVAGVMATMAPVVGVASYFRGKMQAIQNH